MKASNLGTGKILCYSDFASGQGVEGKGNCVGLYGSYRGGSQWYNAECDAQAYAVCNLNGTLTRLT